MTIEVGLVKSRSVDFTFDGKPLAVRNLSLRLGLKLQATNKDNEVPPEVVAEIIADCVVDEGGKSVWSIDDVLNFDLEPMLKIFSEVSGARVKDAEKN